MKHIRRLLAGISAGLVLVLVMGEAAIPAFAASVVYVNDNTINDPSPSFCPGTPYTTIQAGVDQAIAIGAKTVTVCQGDYSAGALITDVATGLKVQNKGNVVIQPPLPFGGCFIFCPTIFFVVNSNKVTIQGFVIDGGNDIESAYGFIYLDSSGSILKNTIRSWRHSTPNATGSTFAEGILVLSTGVAKKVKIDHNSIIDVGDVGIRVEGSPSGVTISHNLITQYAVWTNNGAPNYADYEPAAIKLVGTKKAKITNNTLDSDGNFSNSAPSIRGVYLLDSSQNQIKANTINNFWTAIRAVADCSSSSMSNSNNISSNKLNDNVYGVALANHSVPCAGQTNLNKILSNKIYNHTTFAHAVYIVPSGPEVATGNQIKKNKIGGYGTFPLNIVVGNTVSGNKVTVVAAPGAAPQSAVTVKGP